MRPVPRDAETPPKKNALTFFLSPIIFHQPIFAMYNNEPWKLPVAHTWGSWQSKQSYETSCLSVWVSAAKPNPDFGLTRSTSPDFRVQSGRVGPPWCKNGLDRVDLKKGPKLDSTQRCKLCNTALYLGCLLTCLLFSLILTFVSAVFNCFNVITLVPKRLYVCKL